MTPMYHARMKSILEEEIASLRDGDLDFAVVTCPDENEFASLVSEAQVKVAVRERVAAGIRARETALCRLEDPSYGVCVECGEEIGLARLLALPTAEYCVECQKDLEEPRRLSA